jgi:cyclophilin family peptidyl-prolyl cis-trans isomerase
MQNKINVALGIIILIVVGVIALKPSGDKAGPVEDQNVLSKPQENSPMPSTSTSVKGAKQYQQAEQVIKAGKAYTATLKTSAGDIVVELSKDTPITTNNFVFLSQEKFYDGVIFHRVIPSFMIQGGDPTGTGMGGPGYKFADEKFTGEYKRGTIAMANSGPNTNGSQFFIMHADYALPPNYVIFGMTKSGLDVVDKIAAGKTGASDRPVEPVTITTIEISEK